MNRASALILVVEDVEDIRIATLEALAHAGYDVLGAASAEAALALLAEEPTIGVLFTDIVLGRGLDGYELAQRAVALRPSLKVLYTTGYAARQRDTSPAGRLLPKPYRAAQLLREVSGLIEAP
ncbi:MAG TPA: response regulator [Stellaceae bacterium]|nr:response regulator [Stellaceae bacterium]